MCQWIAEKFAIPDKFSVLQMKSRVPSLVSFNVFLNIPKPESSIIVVQGIIVSYMISLLSWNTQLSTTVLLFYVFVRGFNILNRKV